LIHPRERTKRDTTIAGGARRGKRAGADMPVTGQNWIHEKAELAAAEPTGAGPLSGQFVQLTRSLLDATTVAAVLRKIVAATRSIVPGADLVSITLRDPDGAFHTPIETGPLAVDLDQVQYDTGEGPCVLAARQPGPGHALSDDLATEPGWPTFGPAASSRGFHSVLATTLPAAQPPHLSGALNIYSHRRHAFNDHARDLALLLATHASLALANTHALTIAELWQVQLRKAIDTRDVIGQAKGILMERRGCTADEAFDLLRRTSQDLNVKLAQLAHILATRHTELDLPDRQ
jgi:GAF domain-containing protein